MSLFRTGAQLAVLAALVTGLSAEAAGDFTPSNEVRQKNPAFPSAELRRGHEGWVIVEYSVDAEGNVGDATISDSSGSRAFEKAALAAVREWQFESGDARTTSVLVQFVYEQARLHVSKSFYRKLRKVHEAIELGELDAAADAISAIRRSKSLDAAENAYLLIAEGRLAEHSGDPEGQLGYFRMAALAEGRWLGRRYYLKLLHGITVLELGLGDFESALAHYDELNRTGEGRKLAANLDGAIAAIPAQLLASSGDAAGFAPAEQVVDVVREFPQSQESRSTMEGAADDGSRPPPALSPDSLQLDGA